MLTAALLAAGFTGALADTPSDQTLTGRIDRVDDIMRWVIVKTPSGDRHRMEWTSASSFQAGGRALHSSDLTNEAPVEVHYTVDGAREVIGRMEYLPAQVARMDAPRHAAKPRGGRAHHPVQSPAAASKKSESAVHAAIQAESKGGLSGYQHRH